MLVAAANVANLLIAGTIPAKGNCNPPASEQDVRKSRQFFIRQVWCCEPWRSCAGLLVILALEAASFLLPADSLA